MQLRNSVRRFVGPRRWQLDWDDVCEHGMNVLLLAAGFIVDALFTKAQLHAGNGVAPLVYAGMLSGLRSLLRDKTSKRDWSPQALPDDKAAPSHPFLPPLQKD